MVSECIQAASSIQQTNLDECIVGVGSSWFLRKSIMARSRKTIASAIGHAQYLLHCLANAV